MLACVSAYFCARAAEEPDGTTFSHSVLAVDGADMVRIKFCGVPLQVKLANLQFKGADSIVLLQVAAQRVRAAGYEIGNIDSTIIAQAPKLAAYIPAMCERIAAALGLTVSQVNVKAKTAEKMGPVGEGQSMEARAVVLLAVAGG